MFVSQPEIPVPLAVEFPFPAWATRAGGSGDAAARAGDTGRPATAFDRLPVAADDDPPPF